MKVGQRDFRAAVIWVVGTGEPAVCEPSLPWSEADAGYGSGQAGVLLA